MTGDMRDSDRELLYRASLEFNATLDPEELLPRIFDRALEILDAEAGSIWLREGDQLVCRIARGPVEEQIEGLELPVGAGIVGSVAAGGEPELVADARDDPRFVHQVDEATGFETRSMVAAPLRAKDQVVGVLQVLNKRDGAEFDEDDLALLDGLGATAGLALRNARLHDAERRAQDLQELLAITREIASSLEVERLALSVVNLGSRILSYDRAALSLVEGGEFELRAVSGQESVDTREPEMERLERMVGWLAERGEELYLEDLGAWDGEEGAASGQGDEMIQALRSTFDDYLRERGVRSICFIPLEDEEGRLGALYLEASNPRFLGEQGFEAARLLATQTSVALRNAELYGQVPFIGVLEPVARLRRRLETMPRGKLLRRVALPAVVLLAILAIPWAERIDLMDAHLRPGDRMPVRATVSGVIAEVSIEEGQSVTEGDLLARLQNDELRTVLEETEAELAAAERRAARARSDGDNGEARMAEIAVDRHRSVLNLLRQRRERTRLEAPVSGTVLTPRPGELLGERLDRGETFVVLGRKDRLELEGSVSQREIERVERGQDVRLKVSALPGRTFVGTVHEIAPGAARTGSRRAPAVEVRAILENDHGLLRPGMEGEAKVLGPTEPIGFHLLRPLVDWVRLRFWW